MSGLFQRLFKTGQAEAHALVDKLEDPIKMSEQAIRDLKNDLGESLKSLAEVKGIAIRVGKEAESSKHLAADYELKAMGLLQKAESGDMDAGEAERLAREALTRKEEAASRALESAQQSQSQDEMVAKLQNNVNTLKYTHNCPHQDSDYD